MKVLIFSFLPTELIDNAKLLISTRIQFSRWRSKSSSRSTPISHFVRCEHYCHFYLGRKNIYVELFFCSKEVDIFISKTPTNKRISDSLQRIKSSFLVLNTISRMILFVRGISDLRAIQISALLT